MYAWVAINFASSVNQFRSSQLIYFVMQIAQSLGCSIQSIVSLVHRECTSVSCESSEDQGVVEHAQYAVNNTDFFVVIFKDRTLFDMSFEVAQASFRAHSVSFIAFVSGFFQSFTESLFASFVFFHCRNCHHVFILEVLSQFRWQIIVAQDSGNHHCRWIQGSFFVCHDVSSHRMLMRDFLLSDSFQSFHSTHNTQDTVVVTTVFNGVTVRSCDDSLSVRISSWKGCIDVSQVVYFDFSSNSFHSLNELSSCHLSFRRQGISCDTTVSSISELREGFNFVRHSF